LSRLKPWLCASLQSALSRVKPIQPVFTLPFLQRHE
jgi:hypothetical protein